MKNRACFKKNYYLCTKFEIDKYEEIIDLGFGRNI